jgi:hypothetical protein
MSAAGVTIVGAEYPLGPVARYTADIEVAGAPMFRFKCTSCGGWHEGMPTFGPAAPLYFYSIPAEERDRRCVLGTIRSLSSRETGLMSIGSLRSTPTMSAANTESPAGAAAGYSRT